MAIGTPFLGIQVGGNHRIRISESLARVVVLGRWLRCRVPVAFWIRPEASPLDARFSRIES